MLPRRQGTATMYSILEQAFNKQYPDTVYPVLGSNVLVESFYIAGNWLEDELI